MKLITAFTVAMLVAVPAFASDNASVYANEGAVAADQTVVTAPAYATTEQQQLAASPRLDGASGHSATNTGPYVDDNPIN